jgi:hypothetical protein
VKNQSQTIRLSRDLFSIVRPSRNAVRSSD